MSINGVRTMLQTFNSFVVAEDKPAKTDENSKQPINLDEVNVDAGDVTDSSKDELSAILLSLVDLSNAKTRDNLLYAVENVSFKSGQLSQLAEGLVATYTNPQTDQKTKDAVKDVFEKLINTQKKEVFAAAMSALPKLPNGNNNGDKKGDKFPNEIKTKYIQKYITYVQGGNAITFNDKVTRNFLILMKDYSEKYPDDAKSLFGSIKTAWLEKKESAGLWQAMMIISTTVKKIPNKDPTKTPTLDAFSSFVEEQLDGLLKEKDAKTEDIAKWAVMQLYPNNIKDYGIPEKTITKLKLKVPSAHEDFLIDSLLGLPDKNIPDIMANALINNVKRTDQNSETVDKLYLKLMKDSRVSDAYKDKIEDQVWDILGTCETEECKALKELLYAQHEKKAWKLGADIKLLSSIFWGGDHPLYQMFFGGAFGLLASSPIFNKDYRFIFGASGMLMGPWAYGFGGDIGISKKFSNSIYGALMVSVDYQNAPKIKDDDNQNITYQLTHEEDDGTYSGDVITQDIKVTSYNVTLEGFINILLAKFLFGKGHALELSAKFGGNIGFAYATITDLKCEYVGSFSPYDIDEVQYDDNAHVLGFPGIQPNGCSEYNNTQLIINLYGALSVTYVF